MDENSKKNTLSPQKDGLLCIECETPCSRLYSIFPNSNNLRIEHCSKCKLPVDKYIEYDVTLCLLDLILLSKPVWRHLLFNINLGNLHWKLAAVCLFCDGYMKWMISPAKDVNINKGQDVVFQAAKQVELYVMTLTSAVQLFMFILLTVLLCSTLEACFGKSFAAKSFTVLSMCKCLLFANCGKLLFIPAIVWTQNDSALYLQIILYYIFLCSAVSLSTLIRCNVLVTLGIVFAAQFTSSVCAAPFDKWISSLDLY